MGKAEENIKYILVNYASETNTCLITVGLASDVDD